MDHFYYEANRVKINFYKLWVVFVSTTIKFRCSFSEYKRYVHTYKTLFNQGRKDPKEKGKVPRGTERRNNVTIPELKWCKGPWSWNPLANFILDSGFPYKVHIPLLSKPTHRILTEESLRVEYGLSTDETGDLWTSFLGLMSRQRSGLCTSFLHVPYKGRDLIKVPRFNYYRGHRS